VSDTTLLVFHRNEPGALERILSEVSVRVPRTLIIDSSPPEVHESVRAIAAARNADVRWLLPLGFVEPYRGYAHGRIRTSIVVQVDCDESPTPGFLSRLSDEPPLDGCLVPRFEPELGASSDHLRIYRPDRVTFSGVVHEPLRTLGAPERRPVKDGLIHLEGGAGPVTARDRLTREFTAEAYIEPPSRGFLRRSVGNSVVRTLLPDGTAPVGPVWGALFGSERYWRRRWQVRGPGSRAARFASTHFRRRLQFFRSLPPSVWESAIGAAEECRAAGGPIRYLGFDDLEYFDRLTASFAWDVSGPRVFERLMRCRHAGGRPISSCSSSEFQSASTPVADLAASLARKLTVD
jgi:hypothetical protein